MSYDDYIRMTTFCQMKHSNENARALAHSPCYTLTELFQSGIKGRSLTFKRQKKYYRDPPRQHLYYTDTHNAKTTTFPVRRGMLKKKDVFNHMSIAAMIP